MGQCCISREDKALAARGAAIVTKQGLVFHFPTGVAGELIEDKWFAANTEKLVDNCPEMVQKIMNDRGATEVYKEFVQALAAAPQKCLGGFDATEVKKISEEYQTRFNEYNVGIYMCLKEEFPYPREGASHEERRPMYTKWITYVDRTIQGQYQVHDVWDGAQHCRVM
eukprot:NODE_14429_length_1109_cov_8.998982.p2 GENE.NODE_14429_length_1109_cov_8.998982~~NODE_14429_length_1109_cov_8.998982.p2  ORF type:complete len:168 (+),score=46.44 NODE_14429_length_1109_cov_8.998982:124-627(+)